MAALEISGNGESSNHITEEIVRRTIDSLENPLQKVKKKLIRIVNLYVTGQV